MKIPIIQTNTVYHIGTLNKNDKCKLNDSYEGHLLSVSHCPKAWSKIARLGKGSLHKLSIKQANFLDIHSIKPSSKLYKSIIDFGIKEELITEKELYRGWRYDDEYEEWRFAYYRTTNEAFEEVNQCGEYDNVEEVPGPDGKPGIELVKLYVGTAKLANIVMYSQVKDIDAFEFAALVWAETQTNLDGAWWMDTYDPYVLSAPRGGIFPQQLNEWATEDIDWKDRPDDEDRQFLYKKQKIELQTIQINNTVTYDII